jgi:hypothetical protein
MRTFQSLSYLMTPLNSMQYFIIHNLSIFHIFTFKFRLQLGQHTTALISIAQFALFLYSKSPQSIGDLRNYFELSHIFRLKSFSAMLNTQFVFICFCFDSFFEFLVWFSRKIYISHPRNDEKLNDTFIQHFCRFIQEFLFIRFWSWWWERYARNVNWNFSGDTPLFLLTIIQL